MIGPAVDALFKAVLIILIIFVPLGLWKLVDIIIWLCTHVRIGVGP